MSRLIGKSEQVDVITHFTPRNAAKNNERWELERSVKKLRTKIPEDMQQERLCSCIHPPSWCVYPRNSYLGLEYAGLGLGWLLGGAGGLCLVSAGWSRLIRERGAVLADIRASGRRPGGGGRLKITVINRPD